MSPRAASALALLLAASLPAPAAAQPRPLEPPPDTQSDFWREVRRPGYGRSRTLLRHGLRHLEDAVAQPSAFRRAAILESAITRLELAHTRAPDDPEILFYLAIAVAQWEEPVHEGPPRRRNREAVAYFEQLRALDPDFRAAQVAFELGILFTRMGDLDRAIAEYHLGLDAAFTEAETATARSNLGEVCMLNGDLAGAIESYERAVVIARAGGPTQAMSLVLALFGLAVALDRYGDHALALERAREAYSTGGGSLGVLRGDGVFFEPPHEIYYYEGLGMLAAVELADGTLNRLRMLREALRAFQRYLGEGGSAGPFAAPAERHVAELRARLDAEERRHPELSRSRDPLPD
jgi:tetratricopeptide (TPR) repeat protein